MSKSERQQPEIYKKRQGSWRVSFVLAALIGASPLAQPTMCSNDSEKPTIHEHDTSIPRYPGFGLIEAINKSDKPLTPGVKPLSTPSPALSDGTIF